jgi:hypothetical protein
MVRSRISKEKRAQLQQQTKGRDVARVTQEGTKPLDDEIHRLIQQPGAAATLRTLIRNKKRFNKPIPTARRNMQLA